MQATQAESAPGKFTLPSPSPFAVAPPLGSFAEACFGNLAPGQQQRRSLDDQQQPSRLNQISEQQPASGFKRSSWPAPGRISPCGLGGTPLHQPGIMDVGSNESSMHLFPAAPCGDGGECKSAMDALALPDLMFESQDIEQLLAMSCCCSGEDFGLP